MKAINLFSLLNAKSDLNNENFQKYLDQFGINPKIRTSELWDLKIFVSELLTQTKIPYIYNFYYVGFIIKQIGKEFDLLRIGTNSVINIELKRMSSNEKILKQLLQNRHYLKFLNVPIYNFTYVSSSKILYMLTDQNELKQVHLNFLIHCLKKQHIREIEDLNNLFDPTNYLVSPFHSPDAFMADQYFLSAQQSTYKREIIDIMLKNQSSYVSIVGKPGTGKSLLTYDIAKEVMKRGKKVIIFNCGKLNGGHKTLIEQYHWPIAPIEQFNILKNHLNEYDIVLFDEAQRLYKDKLLHLVELLKQVPLNCIFSYDPSQVLTLVEAKDNIPELMKQLLNPQKFEVTTIIRHNEEIYSFINKFFDLKKSSSVSKYTNVTIQYFSSIQAMKSYLYLLRNEGWKVIDYTPSKYIESTDNQHKIGYDEGEDVLGHEFDNVVAVIDDFFYYKSNGELTNKDVSDESIYIPTKMLYQDISRTRKKLHIVVMNNSKVLGKILNILS